MESLSLAQAQKIALLSQGLPHRKLSGNAYQRTVQTMEHLGYVQIDTISVVQRAHHHVLWSRQPDYQTHHLDRMVKDKVAYEYWSHAASYLAMRDFRFSLPRKHAIKSGKQKHWFRKNAKLMSHVIERIEAEGPLMAKDFESSVTKKTGWESKPTKQALETLYMQGDLMIAERKNFHKVYDLTERVLPENIDTTLPSPDEHARFLVLNYLRTHGIGQTNEMVYLLKDMKVHLHAALNELREEGLVAETNVEGERYFTTTPSLELLNKKLKRKQAKILSPFDNLLIQRTRAQKLFNFDYILECYVPAAKRKHGYFCLPVLWDGKLVARVDCKAHKKASELEVISLHVEPSLKDIDAFRAAFDLELASFASFNQVESVSDFKIDRVT